MNRSIPPAAESTRQKLIGSAERLFAERGFDGVSVRDIANDAGANSSLIGYYFGGKEGLLEVVYTKHAEPLKAERARLLNEYRADGKTLSLEEILDAFIRPSLEVNHEGVGGRTFSRLRAILSVENSSLLEQLVAQNFDESTQGFVDAICKCLPDLRRDEVLWRLHFLLGAIYYTVAGPQRIKTLSKGRCDPSDPIATRIQMIRFVAAGFRAPSQAPSVA